MRDAIKINLPIAEARSDELGVQRSMTRQDFEVIFQEIRNHAAGSLAETGAVPPTVFLPSMGAEGILRMGVMPAGDLVNHPTGKDILAMLMSRLIEDPNHDFVVFAHEAWVLQANATSEQEVDKLRQAAGQSIEHHPDRTEAVFITVRSKDSQALAVMPITRAADGSVGELGAGALVFPSDEGHSMQGRFTAPSSRPPGTTLH